MPTLEKALRKLVAKITGKGIAEIPDRLEGIINYAANHYEASGVTQGPRGEAGLGVANITLVKNAEGEIEGGKWTDTAGEEHTITIQ